MCRDDWEPLPRLDWKRELAEKHISYTGEEIGTAQRVTWAQLEPGLPRPGTAGSISACDASEGEVRRCLLDPQRVLLDPSSKTERRPATGPIWCDMPEWILIATMLVKLGVCSLLRWDELWFVDGLPVLNGLFGVAKPKADKVKTEWGLGSVLRLIMNLVPANFWQLMITGDLAELPLALIWQQIVLLEHELLLWSASDRRCFFYIFSLPKAWWPMMTFSQPIPGEVFGWAAGTQAFVCSIVVAMGWLSAVGVCQHIHRNMIRKGTAVPRGLPVEHELRRDRPTPWTPETRSRVCWQVFVDNQDCIEIIESEDLDVMLGTESPFMRNADDCYDHWGAEGNAKDLVWRQADIQSLGTRVLGKQGILVPPRNYITTLVALTLWFIGLHFAPLKVALVIAGRWTRVMLWRRPTVCVFSEMWKWISRSYHPGPVPLLVVDELLSAIFLLPLMFSDLRTPLDEDAFCSDASNRGGAVCIGRELTPQGIDALGRFANQQDIGRASEKLLLVSDFDGIGGARRTLELLRITPAAYATTETKYEARRVTKAQWPTVTQLGDVTLLTTEPLRTLRNDFPRVTHGLHIAGLPSLRARFQTPTNVDNCFHDAVAAVIASRNLLLAVFADVTWTTVVEYDGHADTQEVDYIATALGLTAVWYCASLVSWMRKPGWYFLSADLVRHHSDCLRPRLGHVELFASGDVGHPRDWLEDGCSWNSGLEDRRLPTVTRAIPRHAPPRDASGLSESEPSESAAWKLDQFAVPPHHWWDENLVTDKKGKKRLPTMTETELLLGYDTDHTITAVSSSFAKRNVTETRKIRSELLSVAFSCRALRVILLPWAVEHGFAGDTSADHNAGIVATSVTDIANRGFNDKQSLLLHLWRGATHRGSDIRLTTGEPLRPGAYPRQAVNPLWWKWSTLLLVKWRVAAHINELESRGALLALQWRCRSTERLGMRWVHLLDSFVSIAVLTKRRSSSYRLNRVVKKFAILELATFSSTAFGFTRSHVNPADKGSRL